MRRVARFFRDWDVLIAPAINVLAYPHIARAWPMDNSDFTLTFDVGRPLQVPYLDGLVYPAVSTVAGPARDGIPGRDLTRRACRSGSQAIGPYLEDLHADPLRRARRARGRRLPEARRATTRADRTGSALRPWSDPPE